MDISDRDVALATIPMSHAYGMGVVLMPLLLCGSSVVMRDGFVPSQLAVDLRSCGITMLPGVPFMFGYLRRLGPDAAPLSSLRRSSPPARHRTGDAALLQRREYGQKLHSLYGTSETGGVAFDASDSFTKPRRSAPAGGDDGLARGHAWRAPPEDASTSGSGRVPALRQRRLR